MANRIIGYVIEPDDIAIVGETKDGRLTTAFTSALHRTSAIREWRNYGMTIHGIVSRKNAPIGRRYNG